jgi:signal transduction histidine kinase
MDITRDVDVPVTRDQRKLLIVDDDEGPREVLRMIFEERFQVLAARSGVEALDFVRQNRISAAILDLRMAHMNGIELLQRIKEADPAIEVMILTGHATLQSAQDALRYGASDYMTKPFNFDVINKAVDRLISRRDLTDSTRAELGKAREMERQLKALHVREALLSGRDELYSGLLHDINKPLTVIVGILSLLGKRLDVIRQLEASEMSDLRDQLHSINRQADNVIHVVQRYLSLLFSDRSTESSARVNEVLNDLRDLLRTYPRARSRELCVSVLPEEVEVNANPTDLLQMLLNLGMNSLQAAPEGSQLTITARLMNTPMSDCQWEDCSSARCIRSEEFDDRRPFVVITVHDAGPGISPDVLGRVFSAPVTTKPQGQGTGLGLRIVRMLVMASKGAFQLRSTEGQGTTADIFLSCRPPEAPATVPSIAAAI